MKFIIMLVCPMIIVAHAESNNSEFEAKVIAELGKLAQENKELKKELDNYKDELESMEETISAIQSEWPYEAFDCYRTESWDINGTITFNGCSGTTNQHSD